MDNFKFDSIEEAIQDFKNGKMLIVADDEDRENEGDLIELTFVLNYITQSLIPISGP